MPRFLVSTRRRRKKTFPYFALEKKKCIKKIAILPVNSFRLVYNDFKVFVIECLALCYRYECCTNFAKSI